MVSPQVVFLTYLPHHAKLQVLPLVATCHPSLPPIRQITSVNHHILRSPMIAFRRPSSLRNLLVRAEVPPTNDSSIPPIQHGIFRCTSRCVTCQEHILKSDSSKSHSTGAHHKIRGHITCINSNIIYLISCRICGIQSVAYLGGHGPLVDAEKMLKPLPHTGDHKIYCILTMQVCLRTKKHGNNEFQFQMHVAE